MKIIFKILILLTVTGCASTLYEGNNLPDKIGGNSYTMVLNYENRVKLYDDSNIDSHLKIYLETEKPYIISVPEFKQREKIYSIAGIEGTAVYRLEINEEGTITGSEQIMSAGLGLDDIAGDIIKQIKVNPAFLAGKAYSSTVDVKIKFRADRIP